MKTINTLITVGAIALAGVGGYKVYEELTTQVALTAKECRDTLDQIRIDESDETTISPSKPSLTSPICIAAKKTVKDGEDASAKLWCPDNVRKEIGIKLENAKWRESTACKDRSIPDIFPDTGYNPR